jgi:E3 ubiquitin-protein ligase SHPRH
MIRQLRGICTHPQVGQLQNNNVKLSKAGALKTMSEVLEGMRDQTWKDLMESCRLKIQSQTKLSQLLLRAEANHRGRTEALELLLAAEKDANAMIKEISHAVDEKLKLLRDLRTRHDSPLSDELSDNEDEVDDPDNKLKGKGKAVDRGLELVDTEDEENHNSPRIKAQIKELRSQRQAHTARLRETRVILHHVKFMQGDVYHVLGQKYQAEEEAAYGAAEQIRSDLLKVTEQAAQRAMIQLTEDVSISKISHKTLKIKSPLFEFEDEDDLSVELEERVSRFLRSTYHKPSFVSLLVDRG